ncbi:hypothetical protein CPS_2229 [Colwellia psychrerythraea 34H]|uniref:Uncharacterized protein n=1 Tax=Colwellia psychrerythraea (strain 34H / ATCC BAA-681) TaxID=167879 RepID=Q482R3_COLP3|nr:hypothetical protein CPS_2229 [Colwellia psychrerythraea 34H]
MIQGDKHPLEFLYLNYFLYSWYLQYFMVISIFQFIFN